MLLFKLDSERRQITGHYSPERERFSRECDLNAVEPLVIAWYSIPLHPLRQTPCNKRTAGQPPFPIPRLLISLISTVATFSSLEESLNFLSFRFYRWLEGALLNAPDCTLFTGCRSTIGDLNFISLWGSRWESRLEILERLHDTARISS